MFAPFGADKDKALAPTIPTAPTRARAGVQLMSDQAMGEPARFLARLAAPVQPTYAYRFSYVATSLRAKEQGRPARDRDPVRLRHGEGEVRRRRDTARTSPSARP